MNLENVTAEMRPRGAWEATDLGVRMIRRDAATIYRVWFGITLPLLLLALLVTVFTPYPTAAAFGYWWLAPIADGAILHIISRRLFGEEADAWTVLRQTPKIAWQNKIFLISPYRFHFARSIAMPVTQLEGLKGTARRSRAKLLNQRILNYGIGVTTAYQHLVIALYGGVILGIYILVPSAYQDTIGADWMSQFLEPDSLSAQILTLFVVYFTQTALAPWAVGAGFGLYINCRTQLEAWDIEVAFRRMVQRREMGLATAIVLGALLMPFVLLPENAVAQERGASGNDETVLIDPGFAGYWTDDEVRPALEVVLESDALKTTREVESWKKINEDKPEQKTESRDLDGVMALLRNIGRFVSFVVEFGFWILAALLLWLLIAKRKIWLSYLARTKREKVEIKRVVLSSGEISADVLPENVPEEALGLWRAGHKRAALSLLYRASVFAAVTQHGVRLPGSATEGACVSAVDQQSSQTQADFFRRVVTTWIRCAYGSQDPTDDTVLLLCEEWPQHYGRAA